MSADWQRKMAKGKPSLGGTKPPQQANFKLKFELQTSPANPGSGLPENSVIGRDGEVGHHVQDVSPAHSVPRHHGDDRLRAAAHLDVEVEHAEARDVLGAIVVAALPSHPLVAPGAEGQRAFSRENDHADAAARGRGGKQDTSGVYGTRQSTYTGTRYRYIRYKIQKYVRDTGVRYLIQDTTNYRIQIYIYIQGI